MTTKVMTAQERKEVYIDKIKARLSACSLELLIKIYNMITWNR